MNQILFALLIMSNLSQLTHGQSITKTTILKNIYMGTHENKNETGFEFKPLTYDYDALEPYIDKMTMEIHYSRHHKAYYDNFIKAVSGTPMEQMGMEEIFSVVSKFPAAVRNNGGGYFNHELYWENMAPNGIGMSEKLKNLIVKHFGSVEKLKEDFINAGMTRFGSGWAWLSIDERENLFISSTPNQDNPLMDVAERKGKPLLAMDVWEHAYYIKYQNKRADYINSFWNIINWKVVEERYEKAIINK